MNAQMANFDFLLGLSRSSPILVTRNELEDLRDQGETGFLSCSPDKPLVSTIVRIPGTPPVRSPVVWIFWFPQPASRGDFSEVEEEEEEVKERMKASPAKKQRL